jgi:hypothetical protein
LVEKLTPSVKGTGVTPNKEAAVKARQRIKSFFMVLDSSYLL